MSRKLSYLLPPAIFLAILTPARAYAQKTINVVNQTGSQYRTIQSGIDAASDGDTVLVFPGGYQENINFNGKAITVTGLAPGQNPVGATLPVLVGNSIGPAVTFDSGETNTSVLSYMEVANAGLFAQIGPYVPAQGAIQISNASPSILNNTLTQSVCWGVNVEDGAPLIQGNEIDGTVGVMCYRNGGSAIYVGGDNPPGPTLIYGNTIQYNSQAGDDLDDNFSTGGAGIAARASAVIQNNVIRYNLSTGSAGGGISIAYGPGVIVLQNLIYGNSSGCGGGGIALPQMGIPPGLILLIANNTIVDNTSGPTYSAQCAASNQVFSSTLEPDYNGPGVVIVNNILAGSTADAATNCASTDTLSEYFQPIFDHNIVRNTGGSFFGEYCVDVSAKYGNLTADPQFTDATNHDYSLSAGSPAIDAGNTSALQLFHQLSGTQLTTDILGNPRVVDATAMGDPILDIGAYEYAGTADAVPTTMVLSSTQNPGSPLALSATLQSALGTPTGSVTFYADGAAIGSAVIDASGLATLSNFVLQTGTHALFASYPGQGIFKPAIAIINIVNVTLIPTYVNLTDSFAGQPPPPAGAPGTFNIKTGANDGSIPRPITLTDLTTNTLLATLSADASGAAAFTTSTLSEGPHDIRAAYAGTPLYDPSSDTVQIVIGGATTTLTLTCGSTTLPVGASVLLVATVTATSGPATGTVYFTESGTLGQSPLVNGVATLNVVTVPGFNLFTADYPEQNGFGASYNTCGVDSPAITLTSSAPQGAPAYSPITFTANITGTTVLAGAYSLTIGSNPPVAMSADGNTATYTTPGLAQGTYRVTVTFTPTSGAMPYVASITQMVTAPIGDFTLTGPSILTTPTEGSVTGTLMLTSIQNFSGTVNLSCSLPLPTTYTCTIAPSSIPLAINATTTAIVTLAPNNKRAANDLRPNPRPGASRIVLASLLPLALLSLAGLGRRRRRSSLRGLICLAVLAIVASSTTACGPDLFYATTQPGAYALTITATGTTEGATTPTTHTLNITLNITP
jgi:hypothetical protein